MKKNGVQMINCIPEIVLVASGLPFHGAFTLTPYIFIMTGEINLTDFVVHQYKILLYYIHRLTGAKISTHFPWLLNAAFLSLMSVAPTVTLHEVDNQTR